MASFSFSLGPFNIENNFEIRRIFQDQESQFVFEDVEPGTYHLSAERKGFLGQEYGARAASRPGTPLTMTPRQQIKQLELNLTPQAVIAGKVLDEEGEPVAGLDVIALRQEAFVSRRMTRVAEGTTNDLGEFRIAQLAPGSYFLAADRTEARFTDEAVRPKSRETEQEYVPTFYPSVTHSASAVPIEVPVGQEVSGRDIQLQKARLYRIRGRVIAASPGQSGWGIQLTLISRERSEALLGVGRASASMKSDGSFEINGIQPGSYHLVALQMGVRPRMLGRVPIDVVSTDLEDVISSTRRSPASSKLWAVEKLARGSRRKLRLVITSGGSTRPTHCPPQKKWHIQIGRLDPAGPQAIAGSFTADGNGSITGGVEDINRGSGVTTNLAFSGTYSVGADNRGSLTLNSAQGTTIYQFALNSFSGGVASRGRFVEDVSSASNGSGVLAKQNPADFNASKIVNDYALGLGGDLAGSRIGFVGRFHADGVGAITNGAMDIATQADSFSFTNLAFEGSYADLSASTGRATVTLNVPVPGTADVFQFSFYVVSANELLLASLDVRSSTTPLLSGSVLQQSGGPFSKASLNGAGMLGVAGVPSAPPDVLTPCEIVGGPASSVLVARTVANGAGNVTGAFDQNDCGGISQNTIFSGTYDVAANGRGTFDFNTSAVGSTPFALYLISPNKAFFFEGGGTSSEVRFGRLEPQAAGPFNISSLSGSFALGTDAPPTNGIEDDSGAFVLDGMGNFTGGVIIDGNGAAVMGTYSVTSNGRGLLNLATFDSTSALYAVSPERLLMLSSVDSGDRVPVLIFLEK